MMAGERTGMQKTTFTLAEAAAVLSCHKETLRRAIALGELQAARLGREYRISRTDLRVFWIARGGGELFSPGREAEEGEQPGPDKDKARERGRPRRGGPEQLTLPT